MPAVRATNSNTTLGARAGAGALDSSRFVRAFEDAVGAMGPDPVATPMQYTRAYDSLAAALAENSTLTAFLRSIRAHGLLRDSVRPRRAMLAFAIAFVILKTVYRQRLARLRKAGAAL